MIPFLSIFPFLSFSLLVSSKEWMEAGRYVWWFLKKESGIKSRYHEQPRTLEKSLMPCQERAPFCASAMPARQAGRGQKTKKKKPWMNEWMNHRKRKIDSFKIVMAVGGSGGGCDDDDDDAFCQRWRIQSTKGKHAMAACHYGAKAILR